MTRDQAKQIAEAIFDSAEREGHLSKDLVTDATTVRPVAYYVSDEARLSIAHALMSNVGYVGAIDFLNAKD
jgi:hypothetical protein